MSGIDSLGHMTCLQAQEALTGWHQLSPLSDGMGRVGTGSEITGWPTKMNRLPFT